MDTQNAPIYLTAFLQSSLCVPIKQSGGDIQVNNYQTSDGTLILAFSSPSHLVDFFAENVEFAEFAPQAVLALAQEHEALIGFDLEQNHGVIMDQALMEELQNHIFNREMTQEVREFSLQKIEHVPHWAEELQKTLPQNLCAYLCLDAHIGYFLFLLGEDEFEERSLLELRQAVLAMEGEREMRILLMPKSHPKAQNLLNEAKVKGVALEPICEAKPQKPPILKY